MLAVSISIDDLMCKFSRRALIHTPRSTILVLKGRDCAEIFYASNVRLHTVNTRGGRERCNAQDLMKKALILSASHPEAVLGSGGESRCSTTTSRSISPFEKASRKDGVA